RDRVISLALGARARPASLVRVEVSEFYYLVDCAFVIAANLLSIPQTNGGRTALLRSYIFPALDNVDTLFRPDCGLALRNACSAAGFIQIRSAFPRPRTRRDRAITFARESSISSLTRDKIRPAAEPGC